MVVVCSHGGWRFLHHMTRRQRSCDSDCRGATGLLLVLALLIVETVAAYRQGGRGCMCHCALGMRIRRCLRAVAWHVAVVACFFLVTGAFGGSVHDDALSARGGCGILHMVACRRCW